ncbi:MAG: rRNA maturation RNase YbeY [Bacteroidia bacterium]|nr:rRNA maturation RNase YbeY [Bacteroidia bacterium]
MEEISFFYELEHFKIDNEDPVKNWILIVISSHRAEHGALNFIFVSDDQLLELNRKYLSHDYYTDILTFPAGEGESVSGDIYISIDRVGENASDLNLSFLDELHRVMIHGVLHLIGFDDHGEKAQEMRQIEDHALSLRNF